MKNYLGTEPIISRAVGRAEDWIRTETLPSWLNAPAFVAAVALRPAEWGDEDGDKEIYFFFTETSRAFDSYERLKVPRVARVCAVRLRSQLSVCCLLLCLVSVFSSLGLCLCISPLSPFSLS